MLIYQLSKVSKSFGKSFGVGKKALDNLNLSIKAGEFIFVAGASGAGKSTFLKLLYGADFASEGEVRFESSVLKKGGNKELLGLRRQLGIVFQDYKLLSRITVLDNVTSCLRYQGVSSATRSKLGLEMLEHLGLADRAKDLPARLSGGEQQRVAVARALLHRPKVLIADEPTGNLDPRMGNIIFDLLLQANSAGTTVIVATHDIGTIETLNLRTVVLDQGRLVGDYIRPQRLN